MDSCAACHKPLIVELDDSDSDIEMDMEDGGVSSRSAAVSGRNTAPDDVELKCGCHFHWQCLLEGYMMNECPSCGADITTNMTPSPTSPTTPQQQILVHLRNEGGLQPNLDILPILTEELYLRTYPEERRARAFLEFCREGDLGAIIGVLNDDPDFDDEGDGSGGGPGATGAGPAEYPRDILLYRDPLGNGQTGLHAAIAGGHREVAMLLLLLASDADLAQFPAALLDEARAIGMGRDKRPAGSADIRTLRDEEGRTAEDLARATGGMWTDWVERGILGV
ncbi:hypothetical protein BDY21DRAFT_285648 [Lineolata rhizophorae]|uniref:Uncharacterized protein n=1 Tax=Lineolata rhizophorae TaxID=578093 RepID=A0A6A6P0W1_9PEZI|nr:hypothetical protein BDY21DRAFT_285648 [Lineolata rhizophorae]